MNMEDREILDRLERLAFQAGQATKAPRAEMREEHPTLTNLRKAVLETNAGCAGPAIFGPAVPDNVSWEELIVWAKEPR